jgi:hypothetical protein
LGYHIFAILALVCLSPALYINERDQPDTPISSLSFHFHIVPQHLRFDRWALQMNPKTWIG